MRLIVVGRRVNWEGSGLIVLFLGFATVLAAVVAGFELGGQLVQGACGALLGLGVFLARNDVGELAAALVDSRFLRAWGTAVATVAGPAFMVFGTIEVVGALT